MTQLFFFCDLCVSKTWSKTHIFSIETVWTVLAQAVYREVLPPFLMLFSSKGWAGEGEGTRREVKMSWRRSWRWAATATSRVRIRRIYGNIPKLPPKHHHIFASHQQCWKGDMNLVCDKEKSKCVCRHRTEWVSRWKTLIFISRLFFGFTGNR